MSDTTMCVNRACPDRMSCYRYRAAWSSVWQSVSHFPRESDERCWQHSPLQEGDVLVSEAEADQRSGEER